MSGEILKRGTALGRYEIREMLGRGGMGEVYRAWDPSLNRDVAIKVLGAPDPDLLRRFSREAEAISQLNHPNVVSILDFSARPTPYIVMAYLRGEDLSSRLKRGQIPVGEAVDIILGVCAGVHACHTRGVVHRDLKPGNVFLHETPEGTSVKVLDFGVAILGENASGEITRPGHVVGTPRYFSPEQVRNVEADAKSDQYAVGLLAYVALAGKSPFARKEGAELIGAILRAEYPRPREVRAEISVGLDAAISKAMSVAKDRRYPSVLDFGRAILEDASNEGRAQWGDTFAATGAPPSPITPAKGTRPNVVASPTEIMPSQHSVSTVDGWTGAGVDTEAGVQADTSGEMSPRSVMAAAVVVPLAPLEECPVMPTTQRLRTETEIDVGQVRPSQNDNGERVVKTLDLHLWPEDPSSCPSERPSDPRPPLWQRKRAKAAAIAAAALLGGCITWLVARGFGR